MAPLLGPVVYGLGGTEPTVCDAEVALGYLKLDYFLGGHLSLDKAPWPLSGGADRQALGMSVTDAAGGIFRAIHAHMNDLIRHG